MNPTVILLFTGIFLAMLLSILIIILILSPSTSRKNPNVKEDIKKIKDQIMDKR